MSVVDLLRNLVAIDSVSSRSNSEIIRFLAQRCQTLGFDVRLHSYRDDFGVEKTNLVAVNAAAASSETTIELALVGHTDTVPFKQDWTSALTLTELDGKLYGRGSCDTKGYIAAALTAVTEVGLGRLTKPFAFIFTADEELGCIGAKQLVLDHPLKINHAIIGEPTSLQPMHAGKGYCLAEVTVRGREGHSAYPALGASAILRAAKLLTILQAVGEELKAQQHSGFEPPFTTFNVGLIAGGTAKNIIPGECRFTIEWRPIPGQHASELLDRFAARASVEFKHEPGTFKIDTLRLDDGVETPVDAPLVRLLETASGKPAGTVAFGTESPQLIEMGADAVVIGPGDIRVAHQTDEYVPLADLFDCVRILRSAIEQLCC